MIKVENLTKQYGNRLAVDDISFEVEQGEILGFLGPNGAGKSTTMNILTGYISSTTGKVSVAGFDLLEQPSQAKACIGYLPEQPPLYMNMTVKEYLYFVYDLKKIKMNKNAHIQEICELVKIEHVFNRVIGNLSKGYKQRVGLAQALIGNPKVLILDEPTVGLDPQQIIDIRNLIKDLGEKHTIILSSHILPEIQAICDRVIIINDGRIVADDTADHLSRNLSGEYGHTARIVGEEQEVYDLLCSIDGVDSVSKLGNHEEGSFDFSIEPLHDCDIRQPLFNVLAQNNLPMIGLKNNELSLEDIFLRLVSGNFEHQTHPIDLEQEEQETDQLDPIDGGEMQ